MHRIELRTEAVERSLESHTNRAGLLAGELRDLRSRVPIEVPHNDDASRLLKQRAESDALDAWRARWFAHAGLGPDPSNWLDPLLADQDRELLARLFLERPGPPPAAFDHAATMLASVFVADRRRWPADDLAAWMRRRQPRLAVRSPWFTGDVSTPLAGEPEFLAALERAWADPPEGVAPIELGSVFELVKKAASAP